MGTAIARTADRASRVPVPPRVVAAPVRLAAVVRQAAASGRASPVRAAAGASVRAETRRSPARQPPLLPHRNASGEVVMTVLMSLAALAAALLAQPPANSPIKFDPQNGVQTFAVREP